MEKIKKRKASWGEKIRTTLQIGHDLGREYMKLKILDLIKDRKKWVREHQKEIKHPFPSNTWHKGEMAGYEYLEQVIRKIK